ncbi:MAG TPA: SDR family oxidoreductase [Sedimentisphaerales bacterium]|jgi:NAD(P)-dependent dehydrogenase (short-subunit alcohol dehydrogenase family)/rhamnose utilization protein RhaD (predicted bifunctional aldolase and dehydrogenase)|nr:SDR family oxidoreductase [Sedimentisphaerales bacterium]HNU30860.1 SDR family oxidoreductase [Sedimentisphaerales bacterium]
MNKALADLIRMSNITGKDPALVLGGGGNTSVKTEDGKHMYIKASGTALKDMNEQRGWRRLRIEPVLAIIQDRSLSKLDAIARENNVVSRLLDACDDGLAHGARPSVESHLHALLKSHVIHLHPLVVSAYVNAKNGERELAKLFAGEKFPPLWVPYADPGYMLAKKIAALVEGYVAEHGGKPSILFLEKHGVFVTADSANAALRLVGKVIDLCKSKIKTPGATRIKTPLADEITAAKLMIRKAVFETTGQYVPVSFFPPTESIAAFLKHRDARALLDAPALHPEELVFSNGPALWVEDLDAGKIARKLQVRTDRTHKTPYAFIVKDFGLFIAADKSLVPLAAEMAGGSVAVRMNAHRFGGVLGLSKREQDFINNWESEAFRKKLVGGEGKGELSNRIAVVTGAGSGLGRSLAIGLAKAGAMVGLADIDEAGAQETAASIIRDKPKAQVRVIRCDVTNEDSVRKAFEDLMASWGGLDILVNAAGIAPPFALVDMPVNKWRLALEVNLTGYFLMAREAARVMIAQGMGGSIINLSSKSGLDASKNNTAYNATKAGELHMARGWALELGEYGIRVNCIAPGNVFEGSRIWNPEYIRVCAKKYGIRPEEVIPYYVNRTALRREIKGQDIADAVVFLCSDKARTITGQTIVADSGQVMVR